MFREAEHLKLVHHSHFSPSHWQCVMHFRAVLLTFHNEAVDQRGWTWYGPVLLTKYVWLKEGRKWRSSLTLSDSGWVNQRKVCSVLSPYVVGSSPRPGVNTKGETLGGAGCQLEKEEESQGFRAKLTEDMTHRKKKVMGIKADVRTSRVHKYDFPWRIEG